MQKHLKASGAVLALALVPMLAFSEAAFAKKGGDGGGNSGGAEASADHGGAGPGRAGETHGRSDTSPGLSGTAPGLAGTAPGLAGATPAMGAQPPGLAGTAPGLAGTTPGSSLRAKPGSISGAPSARTATARLDHESTGSLDASVARQANYGGLISSLNHAGVTAQQLQGLTSIGQISFVDASSLTRGAHGKSLANALRRSQASGLRDALTSNTALSSVLGANNISPDAVLSVSVMPGGNLVVYTR